MRRGGNRATAITAGILLCVWLLVGCGDGDPASGTVTSEPALSVELDPSSVPAGGMLGASVVNTTESEFTYGAGYELEREVKGNFQPVDLGDRAVIQIAYVADPGGTGPPVTVKVPADAKPGTWRVIVARDVEDVGDLSAEFEVTDD
jgi:Bacterial Ig-like domain